jgi:ABC-type sugar transport system permease subunit
MKKVKNYSGIKKKRAVYGYLFILPFVIGFICFMLVPLIK